MPKRVEYMQAPPIIFAPSSSLKHHEVLPNNVGKARHRGNSVSAVPGKRVSRWAEKNPPEDHADATLWQSTYTRVAFVRHPLRPKQRELQNLLQFPHIIQSPNNPHIGFIQGTGMCGCGCGNKIIFKVLGFYPDGTLKLDSEGRCPAPSPANVEQYYEDMRERIGKKPSKKKH